MLRSLLLVLLTCGSLAIDTSLHARQLKVSEDAYFNYTVCIEEDFVDDGNNDTETVEPTVESVICMEQSIASNLAELAEAYLHEKKGYDVSTKWGSVRNVKYSEEDLEVALFVNGNSHKATITVHKYGDLLYKAIVSLFESWMRGKKRHLRQLPELQTTGGLKGASVVNNEMVGGGISRRLQTNKKKQKKKRRRKWKKVNLKAKTTCNFCYPDSSDAARRFMLSSPVADEVNFFSYMNNRLQEGIKEHCLNASQTITSTSFQISGDVELIDDSPKEVVSTNGETAGKSRTIPAETEKGETVSTRTTPDELPETKKGETVPEETKVTANCCSKDRTSCLKSSSCNTSERRCQSRCNGFWITPSQGTVSETIANEVSSKEKKVQESVQITNCCSRDGSSCDESSYCSESEWRCKKKCSGSWINQNDSTSCVPIDGDCSKENTSCCRGYTCSGRSSNKKCTRSRVPESGSGPIEHKSTSKPQPEAGPHQSPPDEQGCCTKDSNKCTGSDFCDKDPSNCQKCRGIWTSSNK